MKQRLNRRQFLRTSSSLGASLLTQPLWANVNSTDTDYKALVCIFLYGGNDSHNMLLPLADTHYQAYAKHRRHLAVAAKPLNIANAYNRHSAVEDVYRQGYFPLANHSMGINAVMPELSYLCQQQQGLAVINTGALAEPVTREQLHKDRDKLPLFLFAHNHQQRIAQTAHAHELNASGWAGKMGDLADRSRLSFNISYGGNHRLQQGDNSMPLVLQAGKIPKVYGMEHKKHRGNRDRQALYNQMLAADAARSAWHDMYAGRISQAISEFDEIRKVWDNTHIDYKSKTLAGNPLFSLPDNTFSFDKNIKGQLIPQLEAVAKMIQLNAREQLQERSAKRQFYVVTLGGFDTHANQLTKHPLLLRELSLAIESFQLAMNEKGLAQHVRTFTSSEFNRTLSINGDGTDHAWGGHQWVFGEKFEQPTLGTLHDYTLGGTDDFGQKGRFIPSTSQDQIHASLCHWLGIDADTLNTLFPHLRAFKRDTFMQSALFKSLYT